MRSAVVAAEGEFGISIQHDGALRLGVYTVQRQAVSCGKVFERH